MLWKPPLYWRRLQRDVDNLQMALLLLEISFRSAALFVCNVLTYPTRNIYFVSLLEVIIIRQQQQLQIIPIKLNFNLAEPHKNIVMLCCTIFPLYVLFIWNRAVDLVFYTIDLHCYLHATASMKCFFYEVCYRKVKPRVAPSASSWPFSFCCQTACCVINQFSTWRHQQKNEGSELSSCD